MELAKVGFSMDFKKNPSFFVDPTSSGPISELRGSGEKNWSIASREKVVCCRFMTFLERFEHFKDDFGRSYYFFVNMKSEATHLVTSSDLVS